MDDTENQREGNDENEHIRRMRVRQFGAILKEEWDVEEIKGLIARVNKI